jgi:hypothetical protein
MTWTAPIVRGRWHSHVGTGRWTSIDYDQAVVIWKGVGKFTVTDDGTPVHQDRTMRACVEYVEDHFPRIPG